jgi:PIN domain nuclease of toxin-antitoxin system
MNEWVLDASALLALLNQEPGSKLVEGHLPQAVMSSVNFSEVLSKLVDQGIPPSKAQEILDNLKLRVIPFDYKQASLSGLLRTETKAFGLSLGDRACLCLAISLKLPALTADRLWEKLNLPGLKVTLIR